ncbi:MAG: prolipoprotein diacylglyceryl transferase [Rikenellaceae bacterium]
MINLLYIDWNFDPTLFTIFGLEIRYYSLMWVLAILIGAKYFDRFCRLEGLKPEISETVFIYGTVAIMLGARIGHCLFYEPEVYLARPWAIITEIRQGGLASHGAALGFVIGMWFFSRRMKMPMLWSLDRIMIPTGVGGALVRLGNLFNSEIFGTQTTLPWGFKFHRSREWVNLYAPEACHPTQLYEAICYMITFAVVWVMYFRFDLARRRPGTIMGVGVIGIFLSRILIESIKNTQVGFEQGMWLNMGQLLSLPFVLAGIYLVYRGFKRPALEVQPFIRGKK